MLPNHIRKEADKIAKTWGNEAAQRYIKFQLQPPTPENTNVTPIRTNRWISNSEHQVKKLNDRQSAYIRLLKDSGSNCRGIAAQFGISQGTVSTICKRKGAYK